MNCPKCKTRMHDYHGASMSSGLTRDPAGIISGWGCYSCGTWTENDFVPFVGREYQKGDLSGRSPTFQYVDRHISSKELFNLHQEVVSRHLDYITENRATGRSWRFVTKFISTTENRQFTENSIRSHYVRITEGKDWRYERRKAA